MPPSVSYQLTPTGKGPLAAARPLSEWGAETLPAIDAARADHDARDS
ncbi:hypothetical protein [Actinoplanes sp. NPDC049265]